MESYERTNTILWRDNFTSSQLPSWRFFVGWPVDGRLTVVNVTIWKDPRGKRLREVKHTNIKEYSWYRSICECVLFVIGDWPTNDQYFCRENSRHKHEGNKKKRSRKRKATENLKLKSTFQLLLVLFCSLEQ